MEGRQHRHHCSLKSWSELKADVRGIPPPNNKIKYTEYLVSNICPLCEREPEEVSHFLLRCEKLSQSRQPFIDKIKTN